MQQPKVYKLQKYDIFVTKGKIKIPQNCKCKLQKIKKYIKWYNPFTWFTKYYFYIYLGE